MGTICCKPGESTDASGYNLAQQGNRHNANENGGMLGFASRPNRPSSSDVADDLRNSPASSKVQPKLEDILIPKWKNGSDLNSGWSI